MLLTRASRKMMVPCLSEPASAGSSEPASAGSSEPASAGSI